MHHDPEEWKPRLHVLPVQRGAGAYSQTLSLRLETLLAVAAAVLYPLFPGEQKCAAAFGHPERQGKTMVLRQETKARILTENIGSDSNASQNHR